MSRKKPLAEMLPGWNSKDCWDGMRVQVLSDKTMKNMGLGTVEYFFDVHLFGESMAVPHIKLDNGRQTDGTKCWWFPIKDQKVVPPQAQRVQVE